MSASRCHIRHGLCATRAGRPCPFAPDKERHRRILDGLGSTFSKAVVRLEPKDEELFARLAEEAP